MFSSPMLARLQELKLWQGSYDNLFQNKSQENLSNYETIQGLSGYDSNNSNCSTPQRSESRSYIDWDCKQISPTKPFKQLLEEKLAEEQGKPLEMNNKPKRPYLRKGTGLSRFNMSPVPRKQCPKRTSLPKTIESVRNETENKENAEESYITPLKIPNIAIKTNAIWKNVVSPTKNENTELSSGQNAENPTEAVGDQTLYEQALEKELLLFEALEEKAERSSFCSTNSSVVKLLTASTPQKHREKISREIIPVARTENTTDLYAKWLQMNEKTNFINHVLNELNTNSLANSEMVTDDEKWSESSITADEITARESPIMKNAYVNTSFENDSEIVTMCTNCACLEQRIESLTLEKRALYNSLTELRRKVEKEKEKSLKELQKSKRDYEEEIEELKEQLADEKRKLTREKLIVDKYVKDKPTKKDREEISNLKKELTDLQELMKLKETKTGSSLARCRTQIKQYEKETNELKAEIEKLRKENGKLLASKKMTPRKTENTKMLHKINENLSKLTEEAKKKKENECTKTDSSLDMTAFVNLSLEKQYEKMFAGLEKNTTLNDSKKERIEKLLDDGTKEIKYSNGNIKTISPDGNLIIVKFANGDIKRTNLTEKTLKYYYATNSTWHTQFEDGSELIEFSNGQTERKTVDGNCSVRRPDGVVQLIKPDGTEEITYLDGSVLILKKNGDQILHLTNGQKEIHTKDQKRREYPDGTIKILFEDGSQETRYPNGRIRRKNGQGALVFDSDNN